jgi:hypothetical protein
MVRYGQRYGCPAAHRRPSEGATANADRAWTRIAETTWAFLRDCGRGTRNRSAEERNCNADRARERLRRRAVRSADAARSLLRAGKQSRTGAETSRLARARDVYMQGLCVVSDLDDTEDGLRYGVGSRRTTTVLRSPRARAAVIDFVAPRAVKTIWCVPAATTTSIRGVMPRGRPSIVTVDCGMELALSLHAPESLASGCSGAGNGAMSSSASGLTNVHFRLDAVPQREPVARG